MKYKAILYDFTTNGIVIKELSSLTPVKGLPNNILKTEAENKFDEYKKKIKNPIYNLHSKERKINQN